LCCLRLAKGGASFVGRLFDLCANLLAQLIARDTLGWRLTEA
jgi:hypothetical protein